MYSLEWLGTLDPLVNVDDEPILDRHVPAAHPLAHGGRKISTVLVDVVDRLEVVVVVYSPLKPAQTALMHVILLV